MARWWSIALVGMAACYRPSESLCDGACGSPTDGLPKLDGPLPDGAICVGAAPMEFCYPAPPATMAMIDHGFDTATECPQQPQVKNGVMMCVIEASSIVVVQGLFRITGAFPLVLVGTDKVQLDGKLDLSGSVDTIAAGSEPGMTFCNEPGTSSLFAGGGGGGAFATAGGNGSSEMVGGGGAGGVATTVAFRGGCRGGNTAGGERGGGAGGAIYIATTRFEIASAGGINVGGGGGEGGAGDDTPAGGAGGGSGGYIGVSASTLVFDGKLIATGGGGGGGACSMSTGGQGDTPSFATPEANGGPSASPAGQGGIGANAASVAGTGISAEAGSGCGGGGGGGGRGAIEIFGDITCPPGVCNPTAINR